MLDRTLRALTRPLRLKQGVASYCFDQGLPYVRRSPFGDNVASLTTEERQALVAEQHEICHWLQHRCTAFGNFIGFMRCARDRAMHNFLGAATDGHIAAIQRHRVQGGRPLVDYKSGGLLLNLDRVPSLAEAGAAIAEIWNVRSSLLQRSRVSFYREPVQRYLRCCFAIAELLGPRLKEIQWMDFLDAYRPSAPSDDWPTFASEAGEIIDTVDLLEGCASLYELIVTSTVLSPVATEQRLRRVVSSSYGKALHAAFRLLELGDLDWRRLDRIAPALLACFDLAFDAPMFPFVHQRDFTTDWQELYPPIRFARALVAARHMTLPKLELADLESYRLDIADEARLHLADFGTLRLPRRERNRIVRMAEATGLEKQDPASPSYRRTLSSVADAIADVGLHDYVVWQSRELGRVRAQECLGFMTDLVVEAQPSALARRLTKPAVQIEHDNLTFRSQGSAYGIFYLFLTATQHPLFDFFFGRGQLEVPADDEFHLLDIFRVTLAHAYGLDVSPLLPGS